MPSPNAFLNAFQLSQGMKLGNYRLERIAIKEETVSRYYHYKYNIVLTLERLRGANVTSLYRHLLPLLDQQPIAYGVRNPYRCNIEEIKDEDITEEDGLLLIRLVGHAKRIRF